MALKATLDILHHARADWKERKREREREGKKVGANRPIGARKPDGDNDGDDDDDKITYRNCKNDRLTRSLLNTRENTEGHIN